MQRNQPPRLLIAMLFVGFTFGVNHDAQAGPNTPNGWRWYNEPKPAKAQRKPTQTEIPKNSVTTVMSATQQLAWFHEQYAEVNAAATIDPKNKEKRLALMRYNQFISNKSSDAGMTFKQVLLEHPELSYTKDRPVQQAARSTYMQLEREKKERAVKEMGAQGWGFFFIYNGDDPLAIKLAPSVQQFSTTYGIEVLGITEDGKTLDAIANNKVNDGRVSVAYTPALILVNPTTGEQKPLSYGFISQDELLGRFYNVATNYQDPDF